MRGEETQVLGWLAQHPARRRGRHVLCHPGTHAKWVLVEDGRIVRFVTAMTGELFAVLRPAQRAESEAPADDDAAFDEGLAAAGDGDALAARLFTARARVVGGKRRPRPHAQLPLGPPDRRRGGGRAAAAGRRGPAPVALLGDAELCAPLPARSARARRAGRGLRRRGGGASPASSPSAAGAPHDPRRGARRNARRGHRPRRAAGRGRWTIAEALLRRRGARRRGAAELARALRQHPPAGRGLRRAAWPAAPARC